MRETQIVEMYDGEIQKIKETLLAFKDNSLLINGDPEEFARLRGWAQECLDNIKLARESPRELAVSNEERELPIDYNMAQKMHKRGSLQDGHIDGFRDGYNYARKIDRSKCLACKYTMRLACVYPCAECIDFDKWKAKYKLK